jgi:hypothetical protein
MGNGARRRRTVDGEGDAALPQPPSDEMSLLAFSFVSSLGNGRIFRLGQRLAYDQYREGVIVSEIGELSESTYVERGYQHPGRRSKSVRCCEGSSDGSCAER